MENTPKRPTEGSNQKPTQNPEAEHSPDDDHFSGQQTPPLESPSEPSQETPPDHPGPGGGGHEPPGDSPPQRVWWLWLLLGIFAALFMGLAYVQQQALQEQQMPSLEQPEGDLTDDPQLRLTARYALGVARLAQMSGALTADQGESPDSGPSDQDDSGADAGMAQLEKTLNQLMDAVDDSAASLVEQLRAVPVAAALHGNQAALQRLDDLDRSVTSDDLMEDIDALRLIYQQSSAALAEEQRQRLLDRHGWYARLALQQGGDETVSVDAQIWRTTLTLLAAGLGLILAGLGGFVLLIAAVLQYSRGHLRLHFRTQRSESQTLRRPLLEAIVLFLPLLLLLTLGAELVGFLTGTPPLTAFFLWGAILAPLWPLARGVSRRQLKQALGWHRGRGTAWEILSGVAGYLAGLPIMAVGLIISLYLSQIFGVQPTHPAALEALSGSLWQVIQIFLLACVWAPVVEESVFRGALFSHLRLRYSALASALLSGVIFAAIHPQGLAALPILGSIGLVLALIREWRGSLIASMTAHALNNFVALTLVLLLMR